MTNVVAICNRALGLLGDSATVSSIDPPEGSVQAERCAQFYPDSRDAVLEDAPWTFATTVETLALTDFPVAGYAYAYFMPNDVLKFRGLGYAADAGFGSAQRVVDIPHRIITDTSGRQIILCNAPGLTAWVTKRVVNPSRFSRTFVDALVFHLASMLAGPVVKGQAGRKAAIDMRQFYANALSTAEVLDLNQDNMKINYQPKAMAARGFGGSLPQLFDPYWDTPASG